MAFLFGRKKETPAAPAPAAAAPAPTPASSAQDTISQLRSQLDMLEKRQKHVQVKIDNAMAEARAKTQKNDKKGALQALKKKKMFEAEIEKHGGIMMNLERQINMLESATIESQILATFKTTAATMKKIQGGMTAEDVDDAMDDIREQMDLGTEIGSALSAPLGDAVGEDEAEDEFARLQEELAGESMLAAPSVPASAVAAPAAAAALPAFPVAPMAAPVAAKTREELELEELAASMA